MLTIEGAQNQAANPMQNPNTFIYMMYGGLILFFAYKLYKAAIEKKKLEGEIYKFNKSIPKLMIGLGAFIIFFGVFNIYQGDIVSGTMMILLVAVLLIEYTSKNLFAENGFVIETKFVEWNDVKKWAFNVEKGELVIKYKKEFEEKTGYMKLRPEDIGKVDELFRKYKLKK